MSVERLAVYGTLRPGEANHHVLAGLDGTWCTGTVRGVLYTARWSGLDGYPALRLDPAAGPVDVRVFTSPDLPAHWNRLDAFEGPGYRRVRTEVETPDGPTVAWIYECLQPPPEPPTRVPAP